MRFPRPVQRSVAPYGAQPNVPVANLACAWPPSPTRPHRDPHRRSQRLHSQRFVAPEGAPPKTPVAALAC
eukprot:6073851-Pyramimonas_sp.AAC.1